MDARTEKRTDNKDGPSLVTRIDRYQRRHPWLAVPVATAKRFSAENASNLAVVIAFYAFFSIFPLLLVFLTILGFVLAGDHSALESVKTSVLGQFPVIGDTIKDDELKGSAFALVIGVLLSLYSGLGVTASTTKAFDQLWGVPKREQAGFVRKKLRGLVLLVALGAMFVVSSAASGTVSGGLGGPLLLVFGILVSLAVNFGLFMVSYKLLCSEDLAWRSLVPGSLLAAVLWEVLQAVGGAYIGHIKHSADAYGTFALVLGVLAWLHLGAQMMVFCAELNVVLEKKLWPRPLRSKHA